MIAPCGGRRAIFFISSKTAGKPEEVDRILNGINVEEASTIQRANEGEMVADLQLEDSETLLLQIPGTPRKFLLLLVPGSHEERK